MEESHQSGILVIPVYMINQTEWLYKQINPWINQLIIRQFIRPEVGSDIQ